MTNCLAVIPQTDKTILPLILRVKNNLAVNPQIDFHFARNAIYLAQVGLRMAKWFWLLILGVSNQFGLVPLLEKVWALVLRMSK